VFGGFCHGQVNNTVSSCEEKRTWAEGVLAKIDSLIKGDEIFGQTAVFLVSGEKSA
jgi:hypothetical protein